MMVSELVRRLTARFQAEPDRGDIPGWVLITLMTAGIVTVLWSFAGPRMLTILQDALKAVAPTGGS